MMPSPFPGMDPYLEGKNWVSFHVELSVEIRRQLSPQLRPQYHVLTMERFITETPPKPVQVATPMPQTFPHYVVEIRTADKRELVTSIELLSPTNKRGKGFLDYLDKRYAVLQSRVHLIEIDWLRRGRRVPMSKELPHAPYYIFLSRAEKRPILDVWPIQLNSTLPTIPVPLLGDDEVMLDLQSAFNTVYDSVGYDELIDYSRPPDVLLMGETAVIAQAILEKAGAI